MKSRVRLHFRAKPQSVCSIGWKWSLTLFFTLVTAGCITVSLFPQAMPLREKTVQGTAADKILMMDISGVISEKGSSNPLSESEDLVARIKEELTLAAEDSHIKALLPDQQPRRDRHGVGRHPSRDQRVQNEAQDSH